MYYYIFEPPREPKEYERTANIKEYLSKLGIAGEMVSPTPGKTVEDLIGQAVRKRYSTIIAVGGIEFVNRVARSLEAHEVVFGIIPTHENNDIVRLIGVGDWKTACDQLKRRRWQTLRLGLMNNEICFLTPATIELPTDAILTIRTSDYALKAPGGIITIQPISLPEAIESEALELRISPITLKKTGFLQKLFASKTQENLETQIHNRHFDLLSESSIPVMVAGAILARTPVQFSIQEKVLKLIVGRDSTL
jgi:diacylglycerol kinase family enzyme